MKSDSFFTVVFEFVVAAIVCVLFAFCISGAIKASKDGSAVNSRCIAAGYSVPYYSEGRVYCLDFGEEPRIMRLSQE